MIAGLGMNSTLSALMSAVGDMQSYQSTLAVQASSGLRSEDIAGLGSAGASVLRLQPQLSALSSYAALTTQAQSRLEVSQVALGKMQTIATTIASTLTALQTVSATDDLSSAVATARAGLSELTSLLNTDVAGKYVFAGTASDTPVIRPEDGLPGKALDAAVAKAMDAQGRTTLETLNALSQAGLGTAPFTATLTDVSATNLQATTRTGPQTQLDTGFVATSVGIPTTPGSTGSPVRDLIVGLTMVANLTPARLGSAQGNDLLSQVGEMVRSASGGLADVTGTLGVQQQSLAESANINELTKSALSAQYGSLTEIDLATVATQQADVRAHLTASYSLIADLKGMSLAAYL